LRLVEVAVVLAKLTAQGLTMILLLVMDALAAQAVVVEVKIAPVERAREV
jgi:hypothetical protein